MAEFVYQMIKARKAYGDRVILDDVTLSFLPGAKIGVVGPNGMGKSTLLKIMAKEEQPDSGEVIHGETVKIGFFHQGHEQMDHSMRVIDYIREVSDQIETAQGNTPD